MNTVGMPPPREPLTVLIAALGGQGGGVLADWIGHAARAQGLIVQATSTPGVSQRTGATTYYLEIAAVAEPGAVPSALGLSSDRLAAASGAQAGQRHAGVPAVASGRAESATKEAKTKRAGNECEWLRRASSRTQGPCVVLGLRVRSHDPGERVEVAEHRR